MVGGSHVRSLESRLVIVIVHLLKWRYQPVRRGSSWRRTILEQRRRVGMILTRSPSLRPYPSEHLAHLYELARRAAAKQTGLPLSTFPATCPFTVEEVFDPAFFPKAKTD